MRNKTLIGLDNGTHLAFIERRGGDVPLVLLHGITDNALTWAPVLDRIDARCRVYALDFRGHGDSDKPETYYDAEGYADDVRCFIKEVADGPAFLAGHSLGGVVAVQIGVTAPELVRGLFLEDPPLYFVNDLNPIYRATFEAMVGIASTLQDGSRSPEHWFQVMANAPDPYSGKPGIETMGAEKIRARLESIGSMKPKVMEDGLAGSLKWDTDRVLASLDRPVQLITGDPALGAVMTADEVARVKQIVRSSRALTLDGVGHLIHDQKPEQWLATLNSWINDQLGAPTRMV